MTIEIRLAWDWAVTHESNPVLVPNFKRADYEGLTIHLEEVNWEALELGESQDHVLGPDDQEHQVELAYNKMVNVTVEGQKQHIPQ